MSSSSDDSTVVGVVVIARHGDRDGFYQDPDTYTMTSTKITPLGEAEEWQLGNLLRSIYLNGSSPSYIQGIAPLTSIYNDTQVEVYADNSGIDEVVMDSAAALVQGLWQPTTLDNITLANGTTITSPLNGYQYIPINSVDPDEDLSLEGTTDCTLFDTRTTDVYNATWFTAKAQEAQAFFDELSPYVGGRALELSNMWNIFDYMNTQYLHNATFMNSLPDTFLAQARALVNWQQYYVFSDSSPGGVGNVAFQTMLPGIINSIDSITNSSSGLKLSYYAIAYKPFLSMFNMTGVVNNSALPAALVNYASAVILEVRESSSSSEPVIRFQFKNGSADANFTAYPLTFDGWDGTASGDDVPVSTFLSAFGQYSPNSTLDWCNLCGQPTERGCAAAYALANSTDTSTAAKTHQKITPVGAGFLGAGLTAAVFLMALGVLLMLGMLTLGIGKVRRRNVSTKALEADSQQGFRGDGHELSSEAGSLPHKS